MFPGQSDYEQICFVHDARKGVRLIIAGYSANISAMPPSKVAVDVIAGHDANISGAYPLITRGVGAKVFVTVIVVIGLTP